MTSEYSFQPEHYLSTLVPAIPIRWRWQHDPRLDSEHIGALDQMTEQIHTHESSVEAIVQLFGDIVYPIRFI